MRVDGVDAASLVLRGDTPTPKNLNLPSVNLTCEIRSFIY